MTDKLTRAPKEKRLVIVGNSRVLTFGPIQPKVSARFLSQFIDESDFVIRMNDIKNRWFRGVGRRTDMIAIMNTGVLKFTQGKLISRKMTKGLREVLFVVPDIQIQQATLPNQNPAVGKQLANEILIHQKWAQLPVSVTDERHMLELADTLNSMGRRRCAPSTGICVIAHVLNQPRFADYQIYLVGFGFRGWRGHNFAAERKYIETRLENGLLNVPIQPGKSSLRLWAFLDDWLRPLSKP